MIKGLFQRIVNSGVVDGEHNSHKRRILLTNYISLFLVAALSATYLLKHVFYAHVTTSNIRIIYLIVGFMSMLVPILLNRLKMTTLSRLSLCFNSVGFLWYIYLSEMSATWLVEISMYDGLRLHLLAMSIIPYLIFGKDKASLLLLGVLPSFVSIFMMDYIFMFFNLNIHQVGIESIDYDMMELRTIIAYFLISAGSYTFHSVINYNDKLNDIVNDKLKQKSRKIFSQNIELRKSQAKLKNMNNHLGKLVDKKTKHLKFQNERLIHYAHSNAHGVRGPLARLMGLIYLNKLDMHMNQADLLEKIEHELNELNEIVNDISSQLNEEGLIDHRASDPHGRRPYRQFLLGKTVSR